jgi:hypothetical protein
MTTSSHRWRIALIAGLPFAALIFLAFHGPITQNQVLPNYHHFADQRTFWGVPNFYNVLSNLPFLLVALCGWRAAASPSAFVEPWERTACRILLLSVALAALGSGYYHAWPQDSTLFWDRLPMAMAFMSLIASTIGERLSPRAGRLLLFPLLAAAVLSVVYWKTTGDLRLYALIQFYAIAALPLIIVLFPPRYSGTPGILAMVALYCLALALDRSDRALADFLPTGGHPFKHLAAAAAVFAYVYTIAHRRPLHAGPEIGSASPSA